MPCSASFEMSEPNLIYLSLAVLLLRWQNLTLYSSLSRSACFEMAELDLIYLSLAVLVLRCQNLTLYLSLAVHVLRCQNLTLYLSCSACFEMSELDLILISCSDCFEMSELDLILISWSSNGHHRIMDLALIQLGIAVFSSVLLWLLSTGLQLGMASAGICSGVVLWTLHFSNFAWHRLTPASVGTSPLGTGIS